MSKNLWLNGKNYFDSKLDYIEAYANFHFK